MRNDIGKMIFLIASDVVLIFITIIFYNFVLKNEVNNAEATVINNGGSTTILITRSINWKNVVFYLLCMIIINLTVINITKIIEYTKAINVPMKYKILIIIAVNILSLIFLFPNLILALESIIIKYYNTLKFKKK